MPQDEILKYILIFNSFKAIPPETSFKPFNSFFSRN